MRPAAPIFDAYFSSHNFICCPSVIARRECYQQVGQFNKNFPLAADLEMWLRMVASYDIGHLAEPLLQYRWHTTNESHHFSETAEWAQIYEAKVSALADVAGRHPDVAGLQQPIETRFKQDAFIRALWNFRHAHFRTAYWYLRFALNSERSLPNNLLPRAEIAGGGLMRLLKTKTRAGKQAVSNR